MQKFPELRKQQVALMRADTLTGHVLDDEFILALNNVQKVYTIFDNVELALEYAKSIILENQNIECIIYGSNEKVLHYLSKQI
ncbi:hypothetical protein [Pedobacter cryoconitis]|uniref:Uncharacterized protein n=1 Tax=Pedobacter cryoconitis TaxID=188932 RepID=A0A7X0J2S3_9SPHI|nr:hypothetical protein [Pedobacter cryoconitis]MBB6499993.1 hypothetical protein [Pedobacter cryoconitis]